MIVDLKYGSESACTIQSEHDVDTVYASAFEWVDPYTVRGYRVSFIAFLFLFVSPDFIPPFLPLLKSAFYMSMTGEWRG